MEIPTSQEKELINKIKEKKELHGTADSVVLENLRKYSKKHNVNISNLSKKQQRDLSKEIRSQLRLLVGRFQTSRKDKKFLLNSGEIESLLKTHSSTSERLSFYPDFRKIINELNVRSILDLGCGLNPIALASKKIKYFASDINEDDLKVVQEYFDKNGIDGKTFTLDLRTIPENLPKTDLCLILKVIDVIDPDHNLTEKLIKKIKSKHLIISFSTKKLSGRKMNVPKRFWFEKMLSRISLKFKTLEIENEFFYIIDLSSNK